MAPVRRTSVAPYCQSMTVWKRGSDCECRWLTTSGRRGSGEWLDAFETSQPECRFKTVSGYWVAVPSCPARYFCYTLGQGLG